MFKTYMRKNYKVQSKFEIMDRLNHGFGLKGSSSVKMSVLSKLIYKFNAITIKTPSCFVMDLDNLIITFIWRSIKSKNIQENLEK